MNKLALWVTSFTIILLMSGCDTQKTTDTATKPAETAPHTSPLANQQQALEKAQSADQTQEGTIESNKQQIDDATR